MSRYLEEVNDILKEYFNILSEEFPDFLNDYIYTRPMQRIGKISIACGTDYTKIHNNKFFCSNLDHSVAVALIIWNFTKDKKQTLSGLFHDIATPVFKHCIDFMNGDHEQQETTEELTTKIIEDSEEIMTLLNRDGIKVEEVNDYKLYPIADNNSPKLSADRFEYTFTSGMVMLDAWNIEDIKEIYNNVIILKNEEGIEELGFKDKEIAEKYINIISKIWPSWYNNEDRITMQFIADTVRKMNELKYITIDDLYTFSEKEIIKKIKDCKEQNIGKCFELFENTTKIGESDTKVEGKYCISVKAKKRYIVPLVQTENGAKRINKISEKAKQNIENFLNYEPKKYVYLDFEF